MAANNKVISRKQKRKMMTQEPDGGLKCFCDKGWCLAHNTKYAKVIRTVKCACPNCSNTVYLFKFTKKYNKLLEKYNKYPKEGGKNRKDEQMPLEDMVMSLKKRGLDGVKEYMKMKDKYDEDYRIRFHLYLEFKDRYREITNNMMKNGSLEECLFRYGYQTAN